MRTFLKWTGIVLGSLVGLILLLAVGIYFVSESKINQSYDVAVASVPIPSDSASIARGKRIVTMRGCFDCHGENLGGNPNWANDPALGHIGSANLTSGKGGVASTFTSEDWARAIRHGISRDGKSLIVMPSYEYNPISDEDLGAMVAYIKSMPPVDNEMPEKSFGPVARVLAATGLGPILPASMIQHDAPRKEAPEPGSTAEYGEYLAVSCGGCHGHGFSGGKIPGEPSGMVPANITMDKETGIGTWTQEDFGKAVRTGIRPDGTQLKPQMPYRFYAGLTDMEIEAMWKYLQTVPVQKEGNR